MFISNSCPQNDYGWFILWNTGVYNADFSARDNMTSVILERWGVGVDIEEYEVVSTMVDIFAQYL